MVSLPKGKRKEDDKGKIKFLKDLGLFLLVVNKGW